jgi:hypothetical protein
MAEQTSASEHDHRAGRGQGAATVACVSRQGTAPQIVERDDHRVTVARELQQGRVDRGDEYLHQVLDMIVKD